MSLTTKAELIHSRKVFRQNIWSINYEKLSLSELFEIQEDIKKDMEELKSLDSLISKIITTGKYFKGN